MYSSISSGGALRAVPTRLVVAAGLHQAAMSEAKAHWRLRPAMRNGVPFEQWLTLRVVFHLENR